MARCLVKLSFFARLISTVVSLPTPRAALLAFCIFLMCLASARRVAINIFCESSGLRRRGAAVGDADRKASAIASAEKLVFELLLGKAPRITSPANLVFEFCLCGLAGLGRASISAAEEHLLKTPACATGAARVRLLVVRPCTRQPKALALARVGCGMRRAALRSRGPRSRPICSSRSVATPPSTSWSLSQGSRCVGEACFKACFKACRMRRDPDKICYKIRY